MSTPTEFTHAGFTAAPADDTWFRWRIVADDDQARAAYRHAYGVDWQDGVRDATAPYIRQVIDFVVHAADQPPTPAGYPDPMPVVAVPSPTPA